MLLGELVKLRAVETTDAERGYVWINDREVTRYLMARYPFSMLAEQKYIEEVAGQMASFEKDVRLAIETLDGRHIGFTGLHRVAPEDRNAELGIMIGDKSCWSKGYGSDAILTLLRFAFFQMNLHRVALGVFEFNERGIACYRKCGFLEEGRFRESHYADGRYWDTLRMAVLRPEFEALHGSQAISRPQAVS